MLPPRIFLIGYRGTGKSTVARRLAGALAYECVDADDQIESRAGKTIAEIFAESGEAAFRDLEARVLADLVGRERVVVSLGGGVVLRPENRTLIRNAASPVVWLTASPQTILDRVAADTTSASRRPNLTAGGGLREIEQLLGRRLPYYRECATLEVDTEARTPEDVADEIVRLLDPQPGSR
jgi:shikimate kinase